MITENRFIHYYFFVLLLLIPISILIGPAVSLMNITLVCFSFVIFFLKNNFLLIIKNRTIIILIVLYFYLILNSFISINPEIGFSRNFGFLRYLLLFIAINFFFLKLKNFDIIFNFWIILFLIFFFDIIYEFYNGKNILGFESANHKRLVSFFKDESVVGAYLNGFIFIIIGFLFQNLEKRKKFEKFLIFLFVVIAAGCMLLTAERSNTIKLMIGLIIFFYFNDKIKLKQKLLFLTSMIIFFSIVVLTLFSDQKKGNFKHKYYNDLITKLTVKEKRERFIYFKLYESGFHVFKNHPIFGVGNKNYRIETCKSKTDENQTHYLCNTHPHQIYFEFLSEHGAFGTLILLTILLYLIFKNFKIMLLEKNMIQLGCFSFLITNFIPLLPGGSFFADFNANFFWLNISLYFACNLKTNIFKKTNE